ncbi:MAG: hypothetical protein JO295_06700 [Verrucomicrobia bacterium]|nr:hypothetical protein [Verrucomicrobiota bacterium]
MPTAAVTATPLAPTTKALSALAPSPSPSATPTFDELVLASQRRAMALYPELGRAGSLHNRVFLASIKRAREIGDKRMQQPDGPEHFAAQSAQTIGAKPVGSPR